MKNIPTVYNGRTAEEWHQLYVAEAVKVSKLLEACDRAAFHASYTIKKYFDIDNDPVGHLSGHVDDLARNLRAATNQVRTGHVPT